MTKKRGRRGRPTRLEASRAALAGVDVTAVDPKAVLRSIAADDSAPPSARVAAAKALLSAQPGNDDQNERDPVTQRALRILSGGKS
jgi:hypothetical protein